MNEPQPNNGAAVDFLRRWAPEGPWVLTAIRADRKAITTATFRPEGEVFLSKWLNTYNGKRNIYFHVNPPTRDLTKKAEREDIKSVDWLHVDIDPRAGEDLDAERVRALGLLTNRLPEGVPRPTVIVFSGGGYQGFWKLEEPIPIDGDLPKAEDAKRYNQWLETLFGADNCHNIDRIMRLPGTINIPDERKLKKGRVATLATLHEFNDLVYTLGAFKKAPAGESGPLGGMAAQGDAASGLGTATRVADLSELARWAVSDRLKVIITKGEGPTPKDGDNSRSAWLFDACCNLIRHGVPDTIILGIITDSNWPISESVLETRNPESYARKQIVEAHKEVAKAPVLLYKTVPMHNARQFVRVERPSLMHYNDDFLTHAGTAYRDLENATIKSNLWKFMEAAQRPGKKNDEPDYVPFNPSRTDIQDALDALKGIAHVERDTHEPPCWLDGRAGPAARDLLACRNGLLHLPTMKLLPGEPAFFTRNALDFDFDAEAPAPGQWLAFLTDLFGDDEHQISLLQEIMGYLLVPDTSQQKIFLIKGPLRAGKGTIARVIERLVGTHNTCGPTMNSLAGNFGLAQLIGKQLAIVSDMRLGKMTDKAAVTENLLRISGEDMISADRKHKTEWTGKLGTRFLILTNENFSIKDTSGALANRFIGLLLNESFLGREDRNLTENLCAELPSILLWAVEGWRRLNEQGQFTWTAQSAAIVRQLHATGDQVAAFYHDCCVLDPEAHVSKGKMFETYRTWATADEDGPRVLGKIYFSKQLLACGMGRIGSARRGSTGDRFWTYTGVKLLDAEGMELRAEEMGVDAPTIAQEERGI